MTNENARSMARMALGAGLLAALVGAGAWVFGLVPQPFQAAQPSSSQTMQTTVPSQSEPLTLNTKSGTHALEVEIARTPQQQALGLMYRTELPRGTGMLFIHDKSREVTMWMKNTYIPLDMVFITADGIVHHIARRTEPHSEALISSQGPVKAVLEIGGGEAAHYGLEPGDRVGHPVFQSR